MENMQLGINSQVRKIDTKTNLGKLYLYIYGYRRENTTYRYEMLGTYILFITAFSNYNNIK